MAAEHPPRVEPKPTRHPWPGRRSAAGTLRPGSPTHNLVLTQTGGAAVDPRLVVDPLDVAAASASGLLRFAARLTDPSGAPLGDAAILFTISVAARTTVKCAAVTDATGVARAESTLPAGLFEHERLEFRVSFAGAPPRYWPVSVAAEFC